MRASHALSTRILILLAMCLSLVAPALAQTLTYPVPAAVVWDAAPVGSDVIGYTVTVNGVSTTVSLSACSGATCSFAISVPSSATQTVSVQAVNMWGPSPAATLAFAATLPGKSTNVKVEKR